jgi:hypothetical protein
LTSRVNINSRLAKLNGFLQKFTIFTKCCFLKCKGLKHFLTRPYYHIYNNQNIYNLAIFHKKKKHIKAKGDTPRVKFYKNNSFFKILTFFTKFQTLQLFFLLLLTLFLVEIKTVPYPFSIPYINII